MAIDIKSLKEDSKKKEKEKGGNTFFQFLEKDISFSKGINDKRKQKFYSELSMLLLAGVDLRTSLEISLEGEDNKKFKTIIKQILESIIKGSSLSAALKDIGKFTDYEYYSLKIGEESGFINEVLYDLATFYKSKIEFKRKLVSTFSYPFIVLFTAFTAIFFMLNFIVPVFEDAFSRFGGDLPYLTKLILSFSESVQKYGLSFILLLLIVILILYSQRRKLWFKNYVSKGLLKLPLIGTIAQKTYLSRFCHSMNLLIRVNNPLVSSLVLVKKMVRFYPLEIALEEIEKDILQGELLFQAMAKHTIFPNRMISLIKVAEEVNKLDEVFDRLYNQYTEETENSSKTISSLLEPFLIIFIGLFVGVILIAMYLPLFEIGSGM